MNYVKTPIVDVLGGLLADKANLGEEIDAAKAVLIGQDAQFPEDCAFEGEMFRATVTFGNKKVVDYKAVIAELASLLDMGTAQVNAIIERHTERAEGVPTVRCTARKGR